MSANGWETLRRCRIGLGPVGVGLNHSTEPLGSAAYCRSMAREVLAARPLTKPALTRLPVDAPRRQEILAAHADAILRNVSGYLDPESGLFVLSAWFLAERGYCCERGCRHCPYIEDGPS
jgi:hypothetical protein